MSRIIDEHGMPKFDLEEFDLALKLLANKMEERDIEPFDIYAVGGYVCLLKGKRDFTHDIDAYYRGNDELLKAISEVSIEIKNPEWLNNDVNYGSYLDIPTLNELLSVKDSFEFINKIGRINMYCASAFTVIFMKLVSFRIDESNKTDVQDICDLAVDYDVDTVINSLMKYKPLCKNSYSFEDYIANFLLSLYVSHQITDEEYIKYSTKYC